MGLRADTVNWDSLGQPLVNVVDHAAGHFGVIGNVEIIIVDVKLCGRVGGASGAEGDANEVLTKHAAENAVSEATVLGEDFVDHIPLEDLAFVPCHDCGYVVLNNRRQCSAVVDLADPRRQLRVPEQGVTTDVFSVLLGPIDDSVSVGEAETSTRCCVQKKLVWNAESRCSDLRRVLTLDGVPFHAILGSDLSKAVLGDSHQGAVAEMVVVDLSAEVGFAFGRELGVQSAGCSRTSRRGRGVSSTGRSGSWGVGGGGIW
jgi:hypothetical protein